MTPLGASTQACDVVMDSALCNSFEEDTATHGVLPQDVSESLKICTYFNFNTQNSVFVFYCCYNKLPPAYWLKTTQIYFLIALEVRSLASALLD